MCSVLYSHTQTEMMLSGMDKPDHKADKTDESIPQSYLSIEDFSAFLTSFDKKFPLQYKHAYFAKYFTIDGAIPTDTTTTTTAGTLVDDNQLPLPVHHISEDENAIKVYLRNVAIFVIKSNFHSEAKSELSSMIDLCKHFNLTYDFISHVSL